MLDFLIKLFGEQLKLSADTWLIVLMAVVIVTFAVSLIAGLVGGAFNKIKGNMKRAVKNPNTAVAQMKTMPVSVKNLYKTARISNAKPSTLVTQQVCVDEPFKHSIASKIWLVTLIATLLCAALAPLTAVIAALPEKGKPAELLAEAAKKASAIYLSPIFIIILGGILTMIGGIIGKAVYGGAVKTYGKFAPVIDGDQHGGADHEPQAAQPAYEQPVNTYEPQDNTYEPQAAYAEPQAEVYNEQPMYAEPQAAYGNATAYDEPVVMATPQESDEEIRRKAREEALAQAKAQQAAAQAQAQAQAQQAQQAKPAGGSSSADDVIAQIEKISREGAPRETMRDVATLLQKERAKPENKTPEQQKRLNEALSKLLKAMSAATKK